MVGHGALVQHRKAVSVCGFIIFLGVEEIFRITFCPKV